MGRMTSCGGQPGCSAWWKVSDEPWGVARGDCLPPLCLDHTVAQRAKKMFLRPPPPPPSPPSPPSPLIWRSGSTTETGSVQMLLKWISFNTFQWLYHWTFSTKHFAIFWFAWLEKIMFSLNWPCGALFYIFLRFIVKLIVKSFLFFSWWWRALAWCPKS